MIGTRTSITDSDRQIVNVVVSARARLRGGGGSSRTDWIYDVSSP